MSALCPSAGSGTGGDELLCWLRVHQRFSGSYSQKSENVTLVNLNLSCTFLCSRYAALLLSVRVCACACMYVNLCEKYSFSVSEWASEVAPV